MSVSRGKMSACRLKQVGVYGGERRALLQMLLYSPPTNSPTVLHRQLKSPASTSHFTRAANILTDNSEISGSNLGQGGGVYLLKYIIETSK